MPQASDEFTPTEQLLQDALTAFGGGRLGEAESLCQDILKREPENIASLQILAAIAGHVGAARRGIGLLQKVIALQPTLADAQVQLAKLLRVDGQVAEAIAALEKAIELAPDSAAAHNDLGLIHLADGSPIEALACFDEAVAISSGLAIGHFNRGLAFEGQGLHSQAVAAFRQAIAINPDFAEAHAKLGNLLLADNEPVEALVCFQRAAAAKPDSSLAFMCQAKILMEEERAAAAEEPVRRTIERDPQNSDAHSLLSSILMELGRFQDAAAASDLALALNPRQIPAYHHLAHAKKLGQRDRPLVAQMESLVKQSGFADGERADLHFVLGKAYDDLGEYGSAIEHFDKGNALRHQQAPYGREAHAAATTRQIETFTAEFFARNAALGSDWEVPLLIVGMPRSGTTLVEQILSSHPDIAAGGELAFWDEHAPNFLMTALGDIDPDWISTTAQAYRDLLSQISPTARRITDKRPQNFLYIALIRAVFPRCRIIHCRRHPVDTCLSIYFQNFARRINFAYDREDLLACYQQYQRLMDHWRSILPPDRFFEIEYEQLVAERETTTRQMVAFCGLEWNDACLYSERNQRPVRTASVWQARQPVYPTSVARWRHYEPWLGALRRLLPETDAAAG
jgi:tetratricopeptide (TPR) repeat protein